MKNSACEPADYRWTLFHTDGSGLRRLVESGSGRFGAVDSFTSGTFHSHTAVGSAIFDDACDYAIENQFCEILDARLEDNPDPVGIIEVTVVVLDGDGAERARLTGAPTHRVVSDEAVADHLIGLSQAAIDDERLRAEREQRGDTGLFVGDWIDDHAVADTLGDEVRDRVESLRQAAADLRADVREPDFCRAQLARAEEDLAESAAARGPLPPELKRARLDRWRRLLEISSEAFLDAAELEATAEHLRRDASGTP